MRKPFYNLSILLACMLAFSGYAQNKRIEKVIAARSIKQANDMLFDYLDSLERDGNYSERLAILTELLEEAKTKKCDSLIPYIYNGLGNFYNSVGNYNQAISFKDGEQVSLKLNLPRGRVNIYTNEGNTFYYMENTDKALEYYKKAIALANSIPDGRVFLGTLYNNLGSIYGIRGKLDSARICFNKAYTISLQGTDSLSISYSLNNFANLFQEQEEYDSAFYYFEKAKDLKEKFGAPGDKADAYNQLASVTLRKGDVEKAKEYALHALSLDSNVYSVMLKNSYEVLVRIYAKQGDVANEYKYYKLSRLVRDSIMGNEKVQDALIRDFKYDQEIHDLKKEVEINEVKTRNMFLYFGLGLGALFLLFVINRLRFSKKQNKIIELKNSELNHQKEVIEEKQREIIDSINYAKRLQEAILPSLEEVRSHLSNSFIYYQPKDIVAGDFYWFEHIEKQEEEMLLIAAADSTGHGVPGAMVSVVCSNALHRAVNEFKLTDPDLILNKTREFVIDTFNNTNQDVKDGMDISMLRLTRSKNEKDQLPQVCWAGANNPLWIIRRGEVIEFKADKQPVGMHSDAKAFTRLSIPVEKNDCIYLFTDGYSDQFGGTTGKN